MNQTELLKKHKKAYGGELQKTRKGRAHPRPISTKYSMHLVLRSSQAKGAWSFRRFDNEYKIHEIVERFSAKYGVKIISLANVGNHLHFQIKLTSRYMYKAFIRALTSAIAMAITGTSRFKPLQQKFWDYRPFTRIIEAFKDYLRLKDYIAVNQLEGLGMSRVDAKWIMVVNSG